MTEQPARARDRGDEAADAGGVGPATREPAPSTPAPVLRIAGWAAAYVAATWLGRRTLVGDTGFALLWPASAVALVWVATCRRRTGPALLALIGVLGAVTLLALDATRWQALDALVGPPLAMAVFVAVSRRWSPHLWDDDGSRQVETLRHYGMLLATALLAGLVEGAVALALLAPDPGRALAAAAELTMSHTVGMTTFGVTALIIVRWIGNVPGTGLARFRPVVRAATRADLVAAAVAVAAAVLVIEAGFIWFPDAPVSFVMVMVVVGVSLRFSAPTTGTFALLVTTAACWLTLEGYGPAAQIPEPHRRAVAFGLFATALVVTGVTIAVSRRERDGIIAQLQESEHAAAVLADDLSLVLASLEEGVAVVEEGGRFIHANAAIGRLLHMPDFNDEQVEEVGTYHLVHPDGSPLLESEVPHVRAFAGEEDVHDVLHLNRTDVPGDRVFEVSSRLLPQIRSTDLPRAVTTIRDVTAEYEQRDALTSFAHVVAHDLRSPLTSVELWARELLDSYAEGPVDAETGAMMARHIASGAGRMQNFISDLLGYALARDQTPSPTALDLKDVVEAVVETIVAVEGGAPDVRFDGLPQVWCDPVLVPQLFDNLIGNARKYVADGVVPRVRIEAVPLAGDWARVQVIDNGIGIAPEDRTRVFETFERARATEYEGTGLGLAICRHIVERHGGTIRASSPPDGFGTCIELTLPMTGQAFERATHRMELAHDE